MKIFHFDKATGELLGESEARLDPLETKGKGSEAYLVPANATEIAPPEAGKNEKAVFDGSTWRLVPDFRGPFYKPDGTAGAISRLGEELPIGATLYPSPAYIAARDLAAEQANAKAEEEKMIAAEIAEWNRAEAIKRLRERGLLQ